MLNILSQLRATTTEPWIAVGVLVLSVLSIVLSVLIAVVLIQGYRTGPSNRGTLLLAGGLLLLITVPEVLRIGLPTVVGIGTIGRSIIVSTCELLGLGSILGAIYGGEG
jgi:hypothetical protein